MRIELFQQTDHRILVIALLGFILLWLTPVPAHSQESVGQWSKLTNLSNSNTPSGQPSLAVDRAGVVHVVWPETDGENGDAIFYTRLDGDIWTPPLDILLTPGDSRALSPILAADAEGYLHIVWRGGTNIYYSNVYAPAANSARNWRKPQALDPIHSNLNYPDLAVDSGGGLHVVYSKPVGQDSGIYHVYSPNRGETWQEPRPIYLNFDPDRMVDEVRIAISPDNTLHTAWVEFNYPETYPPIGIRYANSDDDGTSWSAPISLAEGPYDWPDIAVRGEQEVHVVWSGTLPDRFKFHRWSPDHGRTWFDVWRNEALGGYQGWPSLVTDGSQKLHWLQVGTVGEDYLYYNSWLDGRWSPGLVILTPNTGIGQNPANVSAAVALGNELHVVLQVPRNARAGDIPGPDWQMDIFYLHRDLEAESWDLQKLPEPTPKPTVTATLARTKEEVATPVPPTPTRSLPANLPEPAPVDDPWPPIILGLLPSALLVGIVVVYVYQRRR